MITLHELRKVYPSAAGDVTALDGISLRIPAGEIHGVVGESGAGKSTLIRCLTALTRPTEGYVEVDGVNLGEVSGKELAQARRHIGMVFQHVNLFEQRTVAANVAYPLAIAGVPRKERKARVEEMLSLVGLSGRGEAYPSELSGGQRQRVGIARALVTEPPVLLCDEPTSALDSATTRQILGLIRRLRDQLGITVVIITHEMAVVREVCDAVTLLAHGRVSQTGRVADVVADTSGQLSRELLSVPAPPATEDDVPHVHVDLVYSSKRISPSEVFATLAAITADAPVSAATIDTFNGDSVGRFSFSVAPEHLAALTSAAQKAGFDVEVRR